MKIRKASEELAEYLAELVAPYGCRYRKMFGSPVYFLGGNMMAGVSEDRIFLRLSEADRCKLLAEHDEVEPFAPGGGPPMREYLIVPDSLAHSAEFNLWLDRSYDLVNSMPVKQPKPGKKKRPE